MQSARGQFIGPLSAYCPFIRISSKRSTTTRRARISLFHALPDEMSMIVTGLSGREVCRKLHWAADYRMNPPPIRWKTVPRCRLTLGGLLDIFIRRSVMAAAPVSSGSIPIKSSSALRLL
jgi:hypothetical protein